MITVTGKSVLARIVKKLLVEMLFDAMKVIFNDQTNLQLKDFGLFLS